MCIKCFLKNEAGGARKGSGRAKTGYYNGLYCGSSWELAYLIYNIENGNEVKRCDEKFEYINSYGKNSHYHPDFVVEDKIVEIKGPQDKEWQNKYKFFPDKERLIVINKDEIYFYIDYVKAKFKVKNIIKLYDDYKPKYEYKCHECGIKFFVDRKKKTEVCFCSSKCSGVYRARINHLTKKY